MRICYMAIFCLLTLSLLGCPANFPTWHGKLYIASSEDQAIIRSQSDEKILANSPEFDNFVCTSYADLEELIRILHQCKSWKKP